MCSVKKVVFKIVAKFKRKHLCRSHLVIKLQVSSSSCAIDSVKMDTWGFENELSLVSKDAFYYLVAKFSLKVPSRS